MHTWKTCTQQLEEFPHLFPDLWSTKWKKPVGATRTVSETSATIKHLKDAGVESLITFPCNSPIWSVQRQMDLGEWQQMIISLSRWWFSLQLLYQMWFIAWVNQHHLWWLVCSYWSANGFSSIPVKGPAEQSTFSWQGWQCTFNVLSQGISTLQPCVISLFFRDLDHLSFPQYITWVYYIDDIMLIAPSEWEIATIIDLLVRHVLESGK